MLHFNKNLLLSLLCAILLAACGATTASDDADDTTPPPSNNTTITTPTFTISLGDDIATTGAPTLANDYDSLEAASEDARDNTQNESKTLVLDGLAVQAGVSQTYTRPNAQTEWDTETQLVAQTHIVSNITTPRLSLTFDEEGKISAAILHVGAKGYTATYNMGEIIVEDDTEENSSEEFFANIDNATTDHFGVVNLGRKHVSRTDKSIDFSAQYMIAFNWVVQTELLSLEDTTDDYRFILGYGFAGMESSSLPDNITVEFKGGGNGFYQTRSTEYYPEFDLTADVHFGERTVGLIATNTIECNDDDDSEGLCKNSTPLPLLNFTGKLGYAENTNVITGAVVSTSGMNGTANARFYGTGENAVKELGGTFSMIKGNSEAYHGLFGAREISREVIPTDTDTGGDNNGGSNNTPVFTASDVTTINALGADITATPKTTYFDSANFATLADVVSDDATLQGLAVSLNTATGYTRADAEANNAWNITDKTKLQIDSQITPTRFTDSAVTLTFDATAGNITGATIYADADYTATAKTGTDMLGDFDSDYMAYITWSSAQTVTSLDDSQTTGTLTNIDGMMIAGVLTVNSDVNASIGTAEFTGEGVGVYGTETASDNVTFDVTADVDFGARTMALTTDTSCASCASSFDASKLNFTALSLSFANSDGDASVNSISKAVTLDNTLTGTLDARFYGAGAEEFGGTFALADTTADNERYYYGAFGAKKLPPPIVHIFGDISQNYYNSRKVNRTGSYGYEYPAKSPYNAIGVTNSSDILSQTIKIQQSGSYSLINGITVKTLRLDGTTSTTVEFDENAPGNTRAHIGGDVGGGDLRISHKGEGKANNWLAIHDDTIAGGSITAPPDWTYHTLGFWKQDNDFGAFSTGLFTNNIPTAGNATFNGKSYGFYKLNSTNYITRSTAVITANFGNGSANVMITGTRKTPEPSFGSTSITTHGFTSNTSSDAPELNFTNNLTYDARYKWFRGDINSSALNGSAVMKLYGPNAEEAGGTFRLTGENQTYVGAFGAKK